MSSKKHKRKTIKHNNHTQKKNHHVSWLNHYPRAFLAIGALLVFISILLLTIGYISNARIGLAMLSIFFGGTHALIALRGLRLLRVFRILKLVRFVGASDNIGRALRASRYKILVFLTAVVVLCVILGTIMYLVEGEKNGFTSIPLSVYWAIVTLTTVGYGDIAPHTGFGQLIASVVMILGYAIIPIPTGIVTSELTRQMEVQTNTQVCSNCSSEKHKDKAKFCYDCGEKL